NVHVDYLLTDRGTPVGFWGSVNNSYNAFAVETFIDELAHAAKKDPYEYRRDLLGKAPRHLGALNLAASKAGWGTAPPAGRARGIAVYKAFESYVAEVAEVAVASDGGVKVHRGGRAGGGQRELRGDGEADSQAADWESGVTTKCVVRGSRRRT